MGQEAALDHRNAELGDVRLHYVVAGSGDPVLLLHGWPQTWYCWRKVIPALAQRYRVVAPDLRGLGDSSRPLGGYDKRTLADDVHRLMTDELGHDRFSVAGHDWGGVTAYSLAAHHPDAVAALAVIDVTIPGTQGLDISQGGRRWHHAFHRIPELPEALISGREAAYLGWFYENFGHRPGVLSSEDVGEYLRTYTQPDALRAGLEYYRATPQDVTDSIAAAERGLLPIPVLAVGGAKGWGRGSEVAESLRQLATQVEEVVIDQAGHWIPEEQPDALAKHLAGFFGKSAGARPGAL